MRASSNLALLAIYLSGLGACQSGRTVAVAVASRIAAGGAHSLAVKSDGTLWAWGYNGRGQLGDGTKTDRLTPVRVGTDAGWASIAAGSSYTLALKTDHTLWSWGANESGQLGDGSVVDRNAPARVGTDSDWASVSAFFSQSAALKANGTLWTGARTSTGSSATAPPPTGLRRCR